MHINRGLATCCLEGRFEKRIVAEIDMPGASDLHLVGIVVSSLEEKIIWVAVWAPELFFVDEERHLQVDVNDIAVQRMSVTQNCPAAVPPLEKSTVSSSKQTVVIAEAS